MAVTEAADTLASEVNKQYEDGLSYKRRMGFLEKWPEYERMKAGDQWPKAGPKTQNLPRPVFNIIKMIESHKVANVMSEQIKMIFSPQEDDEDPDDAKMVRELETGELFSRFSEATWERIKQDELDEEGLDVAANTGTGIWHYYWDNDVKGGNKNPWVGEMEGEIIDPINFFPGNPQQRRVQKQPYIIISSREMVDSVKAYAKANDVSPAMISLIKPDKDVQNEAYDGAKTELADSAKVTVLTKYWRENGTVWFCKIAAGITIKEPTDTLMRLYPIAVMQWERRKKSIFGVGDTEGLIPNQKAINLLVAMQILSVQLTGWPKLVYKSGAIEPSKYTNAPGEMIEDKLPLGQGDGVKYLNPGNISSTAANLVEAIMTYTRQMTGADHAATGTAPSADLNATAIMLLQKAAAIPIESVKRRFYRLIEDVGRIWEEFWKVKYNLPRQIMLTNEDGEEFSTMFNGADYKDTQLNLRIDVGPSSTYSESLMLSSLQDFLAAGHITFEQFIKFAPKNVVPYRERLLKDLEDEKGIVGTIDKFVSSMQPEEKAMFDQLPPQQQLQVISQVVMQQQAMTQPALVDQMQQPMPVNM